VRPARPIPGGKDDAVGSIGGGKNQGDTCESQTIAGDWEGGLIRPPESIDHFRARRRSRVSQEPSQARGGKLGERYLCQGEKKTSKAPKTEHHGGHQKTLQNEHGEPETPKKWGRFADLWARSRGVPTQKGDALSTFKKNPRGQSWLKGKKNGPRPERTIKPSVGRRRFKE